MTLFNVTTDQLTDNLASLAFDYLKGSDLIDLAIIDGVISFQSDDSNALDYGLTVLDQLEIPFQLN